MRLDLEFTRRGAVRSLAVTMLCAACAAAPTSDASSHAARSQSPSTTRALSVAGNHFVDAAGKPLRLLGVDRAGTEYACVQGWGIFDGPSDAGSVAAMAAWHINVVRVPLNEDCWLGINGVKPSLSGAAYRQALEQYVALLHRYGLAAILDLHWAAPGSVPATRQLPMPDADHAPAFWASVASAFRSDSDVVFDVFNEPFATSGNAVTGDAWDCWLHGCSFNAGFGIDTSWRAAGVQSLVDAVRSAGARQPILAGGLSWASDLSAWTGHRPDDPAGQLAASFHVYNFSGCSSPACWDSQVAPVAAQVPVVTGELGENDCAGGFVDEYTQWADRHGVSYLGWTWDTWNCSSGPALISAYSGTPTPFGAALKAHLASLVTPGATAP